MANSVDNALARFLYAILKQKNLKDVSTCHNPQSACFKFKI
jgi:hypothetical protein